METWKIPKKNNVLIANRNELIVKLLIVKFANAHVIVLSTLNENIDFN